MKGFTATRMPTSKGWKNPGVLQLSTQGCVGFLDGMSVFVTLGGQVGITT
jgi:hypothetical protein